MLSKIIALVGMLALANGFGNEHGNGNGQGGTNAPEITKILPTKPLLTCYTQLDDVVSRECDGVEVGFRKIHPNNENWFITCNGLASRCQPCDLINSALIFNSNCQMCLRRGESCPVAATLKPNTIPCPDDGCPFCSANFSFEQHANRYNYCKCVWGIGKCMPCPCGTKFDGKLKCCVTDFRNGRQC